jgi:hypothetical protein
MINNKLPAFRKMAVIIIFVLAIPIFANSLFTSEISKEKMRLMPVPLDYRNYFFFQAIGNKSFIIIGDFTGSEKIIVKVIDRNSDNTVDRVVEYLKDSKKFKIKRFSSSSFYKKNIAEMKMDIISGKIFKKNYSYHMKSLDFLKYKLNDGSDIRKSGYGYSVKFFDPDARSTVMSEFFFLKKDGLYTLIFKTNYYKLFNMKIRPAIPYSVYCKDTKDPVVKETVESLYKLLP